MLSPKVGLEQVAVRVAAQRQAPVRPAVAQVVPDRLVAPACGAPVAAEPSVVEPQVVWNAVVPRGIAAARLEWSEAVMLAANEMAAWSRANVRVLAAGAIPQPGRIETARLIETARPIVMIGWTEAARPIAA
ncbi:hypothetical protein [Methylobacterium sp. SD274]|uniref:hypothetical protein n=1 Tax=Methylobacterium sp. SD274 TaxID=2782009 RepID=UPI0032B1BF53